MMELLNVTSTNQINQRLQQLSQSQRQVDLKLENLTQKEKEYQNKVQIAADEVQEKIELSSMDIEQLNFQIQKSSNLANKISSKVRKLDTIQSRAQQSLERIDVVLELDYCKQGINRSLMEEDYELAANYVGKYQDLQVKMGESRLLQGQQVKEQQKVLEEARKKLQRVIWDNYKEAIDNLQTDDVYRFARLFRSLQLVDEAQNLYIKYLQQRYGQQFSEHYARLDQRLSQSDQVLQVDFSKILSEFLRDICTVFEQQFTLMQEFFGINSVLQLYKIINGYVDDYGVRIVQRFMETRQTSVRVQDIQRVRKAELQGLMNFQGSIQSQKDLVLQYQDPKQLEQILTQVLKLGQLCEDYVLYVEDYLIEVKNNLSKNQKGQENEQNQAEIQIQNLHQSKLNVILRQLFSSYVSMEEFYLEGAIQKALEIDIQFNQQVINDINNSDLITSSVIDDVFFLARRVGLRVLGIHSHQPLLQVFSSLISVLDNLFQNNLGRNISHVPENIFTTSLMELQMGTDLQLSREGKLFIVGLNNIKTGSMYINKLVQEFESTASQIHEGNSLSLIKSTLNDLAKCGMDQDKIVKEKLRVFCEWIYRTYLNRSLVLFNNEVYNISEDKQYQQDQVKWEQQFIGTVVSLFNILQVQFIQECFDQLFEYIVDKLVTHLENQIPQKLYTQLGALKLDQEIRDAQRYLLGVSQISIRSKFSNVTQMVSILSVESSDEIQDILNPARSQLSPRSPLGYQSSFKQLLNRRIDLEQDLQNNYFK